MPDLRQHPYKREEFCVTIDGVEREQSRARHLVVSSNAE